MKPARDRLLLVILMLVGLALAWFHADANANCTTTCAALHNSVLDGTALAPYRWRVLSAWLAEAFVLIDNPVAVQFAYAIAHVFVFPLAMLMTYRWLRMVAPAVFAFAACLLLAWLMTLGMKPYGISLYSAVELVLVGWGLSLLPNDHWRARLTLAGIVLLGALNRETTALVLVAAYGAWLLPRWRERRVQAWGVLYAALFVGVYGALRLALGDAPLVNSLDHLWTYNTDGLRLSDALVRNALIAPIWLLGIAGWRVASPELRRLALVLLVYLPPMILFGIWSETRLQWTIWLIAAAWATVWLQRLARNT